MKILGMELAPLRGIPLERRIQTLAIYYFSCEFFFLPFIYTFFLIYLLFTRYYVVTLIYVVYFYLDFETPSVGGRRVDWLRGLNLWQRMVDYFPLKAEKTADLDPNKKYLFAIHPHGITSSSTLLNFCFAGSDLYKHFPDLKINLATLGGQFIFPIHRDIVLGLGLVSASAESINFVLNKNESLAIVVGGAPEALSTRPDLIRLYLNSRKGFIKLAMKNGASLVPVFQFGENDIFKQKEFPEGSAMRKFQKMFTDKFQFSPPIFHGRGMFNYTFGFLPFRKPITTVVGKPIEVERNENPSREQVEALHKKYTDSLTSLFEEFNPIYGRKNTRLEIY